MRTNGQIEVRRCRPLLGTFVEIQVFGTNAAELEGAVEAAFLAIAHVQRLMSFDDPESEVSRMNRDARCVSPILDARTGRAACDFISVTVGAANCMTADALTKVVFALRGEAAFLLARYSADALLLEQDGGPSWMFHPTCDNSRQT